MLIRIIIRGQFLIRIVSRGEILDTDRQQALDHDHDHRYPFADTVTYRDQRRPAFMSLKA